MRFGHEQNEDDDQEDVNHFFGDDFDDDIRGDMEYEDNREIKMVELTLVEANLNRRILAGTIKMLENSFFWKFVSYKTKLKQITESYKTFSKLISNEPEAPKQEE